MSKITIANINKTSVSTPSGGTVTLFSDSSNNNNPSVKYSDGSVKDLTGSGGSVTGGTYNAGAITINKSEGASVSITGITSDVVLGNIAYVDYVNGDDATGSKGYLTRPYKTISAAESGVTSGDTIMVTTMQYNEIGLGKDEVTYYFLPGTGIINDYAPGRPAIFTFRNGNTANDNRMFHDIGKTNNGANPIKFYITGEGDFLSRGDHSDPGGLILLTEGSTVEFNIKSSTLLAPTGNDKAESGAHFYVQSDLVPETYQGFLKGSVTGDVIGGHYFLGAHASSAVINVGGNVDISAIFCQAEGSHLIDVNVNGKITCGYCIPDGHKYFINVDRVPWFTDNVYAITGTNTFKITAKKLEWINSGAAQVSYFNIINVQEYHDATGAHAFSYVDINIDEIHIKGGDQATQRALFRLTNNNSETYTRLKLDKCKITVEDGFPLFNISSSNEKAYVDVMFQDCSVNYKHDSLAASTVLMPTRYVMFHIINSRFKVSAQGVTDGYILLDDSSNTDKNVQIDNIVTNAVIPTTLLNYGVALSSGSSGVRSGVVDIRII
tara:strand:+ start:7098 stop:8750 length:1653 start_codon:yes stop_codon:yes gene_type:complete